jgi:hypothetical protein
MWIFLLVVGLPCTYVYTSLSSSRIHVCTHIDSTPGLVWRTVLRPHMPASPPPHTHVPAPPHTLTSPTSPPLLLDVQRLSSGLSHASGMGHQAGLVCSLPAPHNECVYQSPDASMQTQAAGHRDPRIQPVLVCRTMVHSAHTPTTRPLPRPAAIASRHATSRAVQVPSALLVSQAAPAALSAPHSPWLSLMFMHAHMQGPNTATDP